MANLLLIFLIKIYTNQANDKDNLTRLGLDSKPLQNDSDSTRLEKLLDSPSPGKLAVIVFEITSLKDFEKFRNTIWRIA